MLTGLKFSRRLFKKKKFISDRDYWYEQARAALRRRLQQNPPNPGARNHAKNVILFVGDGMGMATVTAARIMKGQKNNQKGEDSELAWDKFPAVALSKVSLAALIRVRYWTKIPESKRIRNEVVKLKKKFFSPLYSKLLD